MLYIVRVFDGEDTFEYEYGNQKHADEHMKMEKVHSELYVYLNGREEYMYSVNWWKDSERMKTVDLFAGCGGLSLGFQNQGFEIVSTFEWWDSAVKCY